MAERAGTMNEHGKIDSGQCDACAWPWVRRHPLSSSQPRLGSVDIFVYAIVHGVPYQMPDCALPRCAWPSILRALSVCVSRVVTIPESDKIMHISIENSDVLTLDQPHELLTERSGVFDAECPSRGGRLSAARCGAVVEQ